MADPQIDNVWRAMWVWKGKSGLPEDRYVNTFYFQSHTGALLADAEADISTMLTAFYNGMAASGNRVSTYINGASVTGAEIRLYSLEEAPPRTPHIVTPTVNLMTSGTPLPHECAVTLSLATGKRGPRGRGRIFVGPLLTTAQDVGTNSTPRPSTGLRNTLADRANDLVNTTHPWDWVVLSRTDGVVRNVTGGWIDDAFDTIRKRGPAATTRTVFGGYVLAA